MVVRVPAGFGPIVMPSWVLKGNQPGCSIALSGPWLLSPSTWSFCFMQVGAINLTQTGTNVFSHLKQQSGSSLTVHSSENSAKVAWPHVPQ